MRIALIVPGFSADEDDWCIPALRNLGSRLVHTDDVRVFALRYPPTASRYTAFGAEVIPFGAGTNRRLRAVDLWRRVTSGVIGEHRRRPFDVIHAFWADEAGMVAALAGKLLHVPTVVSLAGGELVGFRDINYGGQLAFFHRVKTDVALRLASTITVGSQYERTLALRLAPRRGIRTVIQPLGVDVERFQPALPTKPDDRDRRDNGHRTGVGAGPTVLSVASLVGVKDHATLIESLARARDLGQAFRLELVGEGPLRPRLAELADQLRVANLVRFHGAVAHDRLPGVYRRADLFVVSSRHEAQCVAALEAAASGLPVVGTSVGVVPEIAQAGGAVPARDAPALVAAILSSLDGRDEGVNLAESARSRVVTEFGLDRCTTGFREIYQSIAGR